MSEPRTQERSPLDDFINQPASNTPVVVAPAAMPVKLDVPHGAIRVQEKRVDSEVLARLRTKAAMLGERGYYRWEVKNRKKNTTDYVEGVTIKGANALVSAYRNCHVSCPIIVDMGTHWRFHAIFVDFENGIELERSFVQRKSGGTMGDDADRRQDIAYQIGISKAERNVVLNGLPVEADFLLEECKRNLLAKIKSDPGYWRAEIIERANERNIDLHRIELLVGRVAADWLVPDISKIITAMRAVNDGFATVDEVFPPLDTAKTGSATLDAFANSGTGDVADSAASDTGTKDRKPRRERAKASDTGERNAGEPSPPSSDSPASHADDRMARLKAGLADATDEAACNEVWERLDLDNFYNDDPFGRRDALKLLSARIKELEGGEGGP